MRHHELAAWLRLMAFLSGLTVFGDGHAENTVVGTGSAASCSEAALDEGLFLLDFGAGGEGGTLTFNCGPQDVTIAVTTEKLLGTSAAVTIDGGGRITLDANDAVRHASTFGSVELRDLILINGNAGGGDGGAIHLASGASLRLLRVLLRSNRAGGRGGAIPAAAGSTLVLDASTVLANDAPQGGGIASSGTLTINDSLVAVNTAESGDGGGVLATSATTTVMRSRFEHNGAVDGGGMLLRGGSASLVDTRFSDNSASARGGGLDLYGNATATLDNLLFERNLAQSGGAIANEAQASGPDIDLTVRRSRFDANQAGADGGAIYSLGTAFTQTRVRLVVEDTTLLANTANRGGAIYSDGILIGTGVVASDNSAAAGGAIHSRVFMSLAASQLLRNEASQTGGGLHANAFVLVESGNLIAENRAPNGAGIALIDVSAIVQGLTLARNIATAAGGGVYIGGSSPSFATFSNLTTSGNQSMAAGGFGGDIAARNASIDIVHSTLIDGSAFSGSSLHAGTGSDISIRNSVVWPLIGAACSTAGSGSIASADGNVGTAATCPFTAPNDSTVTSFAALQLAPLGDNGGSAPTFLPQSTSPLVDHLACNGELPIDARGAARPVDGNGDGIVLCDAGAVERQVVETGGGGMLFRDGFETP